MAGEKRNDIFIVTPMNQRLTLDPGETYTGAITVVNPANSSGEFSYTVSAAPYGVMGKGYDADFTTNSVWNQISEWIEIKEAKGTLQPNESRKVEFTIKVPEDAPVGAQSAAIVVTQNKENEDAGGVLMQNVFEMASIVYAEVSGEIVHDGKIISNNIPFFSDSPKVTVTATVDNHGNSFEEAVVEISAINKLSGESILPNDKSDGVYSEIIVPDTEHELSRNIEGMPFLGIVHVEQKVGYNNELSIASQDILICPIWFMFVVVAAIGLVVLSFLKLRKLHRERKAKVIV